MEVSSQGFYLRGNMNECQWSFLIGVVLGWIMGVVGIIFNLWWRGKC